MNHNSLHPTVQIVSILVLVQAGISVVSSIEASFATLAFGPAAGGLALVNLALAGLLFALANRLRHGSDRARRTIRFVEVFVIVWALFDLALALGLAGRSIELVGLTTRIVMPVYVWRALRRSDVKATFRPGQDAVAIEAPVLTGAAA